MANRRRLDAELVRRGLARSRSQAEELLREGRVLVTGQVASKAASQVDPAAAIVVRPAPTGDPDYVSRGAHKLIGALDTFQPLGLQVTGRRCLDAGASTGGFTEVLLRRGAVQVIAVDVGYGQLAWTLRQDQRVIAMDRTNVRTLTPAALPFAPELVVGDLSFISLNLVLPPLADVSAPDADLVLMVKPQFEVGRDLVGDGVVRSPALRADAVRRVADGAHTIGWGTRAVVASPLPGPSGNVEYFLWLRRDADALRQNDLARAIEEGPP